MEPIVQVSLDLMTVEDAMPDPEPELEIVGRAV